jgi:hypothetical protein
MEDQDYIISHFELMHKLAIYFSTLPALIIEEKYDYQVFGSWWCIFKKAGIIYRMCYDGRDYSLSLDVNLINRNTGPESNWKMIRNRKVNRKMNNEEIISEISELISE